VKRVANPTVGILTLYADGQRFEQEELAYFRRVAEAGEALQVDVFVFDPGDIDPSGRLVKAHRYHAGSRRWERSWSPFPAAVYDRCRAQRSPRFKELRAFRKSYPQLTYLSRPLSSKWGNQQVLSANRSIRPHLPDTRRYQGLADLRVFTARYPIVFLKPVDGSGGRGIVRVTRLGGGVCRVEGRDRSRRIIKASRLAVAAVPGKLRSLGLSGRYLIQQGIPIGLADGRVHDFRLLIQKNGLGAWEVTGCAGRIGGGTSVTSNLHGGGEASRFEALLAARGLSGGQVAAVRQEMNRLAQETARELEKGFGPLCELALDLAVGPDLHVWLLEVNPKPSREVFRLIGEEEAYHTAIRRPLEYAKWLISRKR
jgi:hypothetical protein